MIPQGTVISEAFAADAINRGENRDRALSTNPVAGSLDHPAVKIDHCGSKDHPAVKIDHCGSRDLLWYTAGLHAAEVAVRIA